MARAVGKALNLAVVDGAFLRVHHSWLSVDHGGAILDVYSVGRLPMVQLVDLRNLASLPMRVLYREGASRDDIREEVIAELLAAMRAT
jgi:hypothetical protein